MQDLNENTEGFCTSKGKNCHCCLLVCVTLKVPQESFLLGGIMEFIVVGIRNGI